MLILVIVPRYVRCKHEKRVDEGSARILCAVLQLFGKSEIISK